MSEGEGSDLFALVVEECIGADHERVCAKAEQARKCVIDLAVSAGVESVRIQSPMVCAAVRRSFDSCGARGLAGLSNTAMVAILGTAS